MTSFRQNCHTCELNIIIKYIQFNKNQYKDL